MICLNKWLENFGNLTVNTAIEVSQLSKSFAGNHVLKNINLTVPEGAVYGFLGNNGAGKSTFIRLLFGLLKADSGEIKIKSKPIIRHDVMYKKNIGALIDSPCLYLHLTPREFLSIGCLLKNIKLNDIDRVLSIVDMTAYKNDLMKQFSFGMKQRIALANAMIGQPKLMVLDEPTNGLDPAGMLEIRDLIKSLPTTTGATVFLSSHLLDEIQKTVSHVAILHQGKVAVESTIANLLEQDSGRLEIVTPDAQKLQQFLSTHNYTSQTSTNSTVWIEQMKPSNCSKLNKMIIQQGFELIEARYQQVTLEQLFLKLVNDESQEGIKC